MEESVFYDDGNYKFKMHDRDVYTWVCRKCDYKTDPSPHRRRDVVCPDCATSEAECEERQRLAWLGFYNTAVIAWAIAQAAGQNPAWNLREQADAMLEKYNERWENDD